MQPLSLDERITLHRHRVHALHDGANIAPPPLWSQLDARLSHFRELQSPTVDRLKEAVAGGADDDQLNSLRARALAEAGAMPGTVAAIDQAVAGHVYAKMVDVYSKAAKPNFNTVTSLFDAAAADFVKC